MRLYNPNEESDFFRAITNYAPQAKGAKVVVRETQRSDSTHFHVYIQEPSRSDDPISTSIPLAFVNYRNSTVKEIRHNTGVFSGEDLLKLETPPTEADASRFAHHLGRIASQHTSLPLEIRNTF